MGRLMFDPPADQLEPAGTLPIKHFADLKVGLEVVVWDPKNHNWRSGVVHRFREHPADQVRGRIRKIQAVIRTTGATFFFYDTSWEDRASSEGRPGGTRHRIRYAHANVLDNGPLAIPDSPAPKTTRQAAKAMNFGHRPPLFGHPGGMRPPVDGLHPETILDIYMRIQREQLSPLFDDPKVSGFGKPRLTPAQLELARSMWTARVSAKVIQTELEDARRERGRVVVDDDRWEV